MINSISTGLILLSAGISGFHASRHHRGRSRPRITVPPLRFTDIEPEISSFTIPPVIHFNGTSIAVRSGDEYTGTERRSTTDATDTAKRSRSEASGTYSTARSKRRREDAKPAKKRSHSATWRTRYDELVAYRESEGHCLVPQNYNANRKLGLWVMQQRRQYTLLGRGKPSSLRGPEGEERIRRLEEIGFAWRADRSGPRGPYGSLRRMKELAEGRVEGAHINDLTHIVDFEQYVMDRRNSLTDKEVKDAWRQRFEMFQ